jgi:hypothetical protein
MDAIEEHKLLIVLEYFLSLHEADKVFNAIFNEKITGLDILNLLDYYHKDSE